jgi:glucosamine-6-phosphate deaminase
METIRKENLQVRIFDSRAQLGAAAAEAVGQKIQELLETKAYINMIFAAAPSQNEFLAELIKKPVDWDRINGFHMDEYVGLDKDAPQGFGNFLKEKLFGHVPFREVHYLDGNADDIEAECVRYAALLTKYPTDIVCLGIGENAHLAFNDPHVADFKDPKLVKVVDLDEACRTQQVNDGCFRQIEEVPTHALTITIPALLRATFVYGMVPGKAKAEAVYHTLNSAIEEKYPSTLLRTHENAALYLDTNSAARL